MVATFGPHTLALGVLLGLTSWPGLARLVRAETLAVRDQPFVVAARSAGATPGRVLARHVLPGIASTAVVAVTLVGSRVILLEGGLAFLGLTDPATMSLGTLIRNAEAHLRVASWISVLPGLVMVTAVLGINLLADGLDQSSPGRVTSALGHEP